MTVQLFRGLVQTARIVLRDLATGSQIRSVTLSIPVEVIGRTQLRALSSDLHYAALVVYNDTIVVQDLNDTARVLFDECADCGEISVDFTSNNEELVVAGSRVGGIWNLRSMTNLFYHDDLSMPRYLATTFGFNASGNVLLIPTPKRMAIFDRKTQAIRLTRIFSDPLSSVAVLDDNTILCEIRDSILILDSSLSTVSSVSLLPFARAISWNAKLGRIALQLYESDMLILDYKGVVATVENEDIYASSTTRPAFYDSFTIRVPTQDVKSVHVIDMNGTDVTELTLVTALDNRTNVDSAHLLSGVYCIVDNSSGWRAIVVLVK